MAIKIRRERKIKVPDAIVASTALLNNAVLVTRIVSDFKGVNGLDLLNPFK